MNRTPIVTLYGSRSGLALVIASTPPAVAAPVEHRRAVLDDAALDNVVPRSTRSP